MGNLWPVLSGREPERAAIAAVLDAARAGRGGALLVRGVAGSGKSTLLADVVTLAEGWRVLRTCGVESESPLAFAALQRLLWPLRARIESLPAPQAGALRAAMGEAPGDGDRFLTFLGTLSLLADAGEEAPVLVVIDDAHWLDDASRAALQFAARRLNEERIAVLFAARDGDTRDFHAPELPTVVLGAVSAADAEALLTAQVGGPIDPTVRDQLVAGTGGNPLALVELAAMLSAEQLAGRWPLPSPLPLTGGVERAFGDRYRRLDERAQRWLLVAAADDTGRLTVVRDAADRMDAGEAAMDAVERSGLLRTDGPMLSLYHPLVRSAVYRSATSAQLRAVHRALADALTGDPDRRAWHLAAAADRPDAGVVAALDGVAERAAARGGHEAAAAGFARAAELTIGGEERGRRLYRAASSAWLAAHPTRAAALAAAAAADVTDPLLHAQLLVLQGQIEWNTHSLHAGCDLIVQAAETAAEVDEALAQRLAMLAAALAACGARPSRAVDLGRLVPAPAHDAPLPERAARALLSGFLAAARHEWATAAQDFGCAFALTDAHPVNDHVVQPNLGVAAWLIDDDERDLWLHEQQLTAARRAGALSMVEHALTRGVQAQIATGAWAKAAAAATEALALSTATGHPGLTALPTAELAVLAGLRGDDAVDRHVAEVMAIRDQHPVGLSDFLVVDLAHWARGLRDAGDPPKALHHLAQISDPRLRRMAAQDRVETAIRAGRADLAGSWLVEVDDFAKGTGRPAAVAVLEHGRALLARRGGRRGALPPCSRRARRLPADPRSGPHAAELRPVPAPGASADRRP